LENYEESECKIRMEYRKWEIERGVEEKGNEGRTKKEEMVYE